MGEGQLKLVDGVWNTCTHEDAKRVNYGREGGVDLVPAQDVCTPLDPQSQAILNKICSWFKNVPPCYDEAKLAKAKEQLAAPPKQQGWDYSLPMPTGYGHAY